MVKMHSSDATRNLRSMRGLLVSFFLAIITVSVLFTGSVATAAPESSESAAASPAGDLQITFRTNALKAPGAAGSVDVVVTNIGKHVYYNDGTPIELRLSTHTYRGPQGVDRIIRVTGRDGAWTLDHGFDGEASSHSWSIMMNNPVLPGKSQVVAHLWFYDGLTLGAGGRMTHYLTATQMTRMPGDTTFDNDQNRSSLAWTYLMTGTPTPKGYF